MDTFWSLFSNKVKLQIQYIKENANTKAPNIQFVLSAMAGENLSGCSSVNQFVVTTTPDLDSDIAEADLQIIPHIIHATTNRTHILYLIVQTFSADTDVFVLLLDF